MCQWWIENGIKHFSFFFKMLILLILSDVDMVLHLDSTLTNKQTKILRDSLYGGRNLVNEAISNHTK